MWHEQNFRDRILDTENYPNLLDPVKVRAHSIWASDEWVAVCEWLARFVKDVISTPPEQFDEDAAFDRLNALIDRWINLPPKEAIGLAEVFIEAPNGPKEAASMLIWNFLFKLYQKKLGYDFNSQRYTNGKTYNDKEQASDDDDAWWTEEEVQ